MLETSEKGFSLDIFWPFLTKDRHYVSEQWKITASAGTIAGGGLFENEEVPRTSEIFARNHHGKFIWTEVRDYNGTNICKFFYVVESYKCFATHPGIIVL